MPPTPLHPGTYIPEKKSAAHAINGVPTSIALFIGVTASGPLDAPVEVASASDFAAHFGPPDATRPLGYSVAHYFANGGSIAWVVALPPTLVVGTTDFHAAVLACFAADGLVSRIGRFDLLCVPGECDPATQAALQAQCATRNLFYIADCPADATAAFLAGPLDPALVGVDASWSALYAPWIIATDPVTGVDRAFPPSGFVAGIYARIDRTRGIAGSPAGSEATVVGAKGLLLDFNTQTSDAISTIGVDTIRRMPSVGIVVWGARTLPSSGGDSTYRYVAVRRLVSTIEASVQAGLQWAVFERSAEPLWAQVRTSVGAYLLGLWRQGALAGAKAEQAYVVRCDATVMTAADIAAGRLIVLVGVAPIRPAEFVMARICVQVALT